MNDPKKSTEIRKRLNEDEELSDGDVSEICHMICNVSNYYYVNHDKIKEVFHVNFWEEMAKDEHIQAFCKGKEQGRVEGRAEGRAEGKAEGRAEGIKEGIKKGIEKERAASRRKLERERAEGRKNLLKELSVYVRTSQDNGLSSGEILERILSGDPFPKMA